MERDNISVLNVADSTSHDLVSPLADMRPSDTVIVYTYINADQREGSLYCIVCGQRVGAVDVRNDMQFCFFLTALRIMDPSTWRPSRHYTRRFLLLD